MRSTLALVFATTVVGCAGEADTTDAEDVAEHVLAHIELSTPDGKDHYTFEFIEADGALATLIGSPHGYPLFETKGCVLDTYLSVAPDDAIVPIALRRACAEPGVTIDPAPVRVDVLRPIGTAFKPPPRLASADTGPYCTKTPYDKRYQALMAAATVVAKHTIEYEVCDVIYTNDASGCDLYIALANNEKGPHVGVCDPITTPVGEGCFDSHTASKQVPNPECSHDVVGWGTYGPWLDWEGNTPYGVSLLQAEVSTCTPNSTTVFWWQSKRDQSSAWSETHYVNLYAPAYWIFTLNAGTLDGDWKGSKYRIHANGAGLFPMMAGALMEGIDRAACPTGLFL